MHYRNHNAKHYIRVLKVMHVVMTISAKTRCSATPTGAWSLNVNTATRNRALVHAAGKGHVRVTVTFTHDTDSGGLHGNGSARALRQWH
jgi:hypothetical protein